MFKKLKKTKKIFLLLLTLQALALLFLSGSAFALSGTARVFLVDAITGAPITNTKVVAKEVLSGGKTKWAKSGTTDEKGLVVFDLEGLGEGRSYLFSARVFNNVTSYSQKISASGTVTFRVGRLKVEVRNGADGNILSGYKVTLKEVLKDGKLRWVSSGKTDENGVIRFDPEGLGSGRTYLLAAKSPQDGSYKYSSTISNEGTFAFYVGNKPLVVSVTNGLTKEPLRGLKVTAVRILTNGKKKWVSSHKTDENGTVVFDLEDLGNGAIYRLYSKPYNGGTVFTPDITNTGTFDFKVGLIPVRLTERKNSRPLAGVKLILYRIKENSKLEWLKSAKADQNGMVIFDDYRLGSGPRYVVRADKPFKDKKRYFSPLITGPGPVDFAIDREGDFDLDLEPPWIGFSSHESGQKVTASGFDLTGKVTDNQEIHSVGLFIKGESGNTTLVSAHVNRATNSWQAHIERALITPGTLTITATATDRMLNSSNATISLIAVSDSQAPVITLDYPSASQKLERHGFALSGNITEETAVKGVTVQLSCPGDEKAGATKNALVDLSEGRWMASFNKGELPPCSDIDVLVSGQDTSGNSASYRFKVTTHETRLNPIQVVNRVTFGATPALLYRVLKEGPGGYLAAQLNPSSVDDSWFESHFGSFVPEKKYDLIQLQLARSIYSKRQLLEVMTWFWENHFNTDITRHYHVEYELKENNLFREHALGRFRDLLEISAKSPAMLYYLDNVSNRKESPNENYAREIMELHTLGVDNGYTQEDIVQVARCFTGWRVKDGQFYFDQRRHDYGEKHVLGHVLPAGQGTQDGEQVLDILASHPNTARFICKKLAVYLVDDNASSRLIERCATIFRASDGNIGEVVSMLLHSEEFNSQENFHNKVKTPLEFVAGFVRNLNVEPSPEHLRRTLDVLGMRPFFYPFPTGWPERGTKWINSDQYLQRLRFVSRSVFNVNKDKYCRVDIKKFFTDAGLSEPEEIVTFLMELALSGDYTEEERQTALELLNRGSAGGFKMDMPDAEKRLRELVVLVLSFPQYQLQ